MTHRTGSRYAALEAVIGEDVGRNITKLVEATTGNLENAAASIAAHRTPRVVILTGAFIATAKPPACETDGPVGSAVLAAGLAEAALSVRVLTDEPCRTVVEAALETASNRLSGCLDITPIAPRESLRCLEKLKTKYREAGTTHCVAIERIGPAHDGRIRSMRADDLTPDTAPLHELFGAGEWTTVGIGDGGNEIGMGRLSRDLVSSSISYGARIHCTVTCDHLIVSGVSNWGALGLLAALAIARPELSSSLLSVLTEDLYDAVLTAAATSGAVDGVKGVPSLSVDGVPRMREHSVIRRLREIALGRR